MLYTDGVANLGEAYVEVRANTANFAKDVESGIGKELTNLQKQADETGKVTGSAFTRGRDNLQAFTKKAVIPATIALGAVAGAAKKFASDASDLGESINAVNVTFEGASEGVLQLSRDAATSVGLSQTSFNALAVQFSSFASKIAGPGGDVVATLGDITGRAADFASVMNLEVADAARIFQSGLAGETEPLKKFGIDLSEAGVKAYAMANGIGDASGKLTEQEKILARYGSLMEQTEKTKGDFANTSDSMANRQRILAAEFTNVRAEIGNALIPIYEKMLGVGRVVVALMLEHKNVMLVVVGAVTALAVGVLAINTAFKVYTALTKAAAAATKLLSIAMAANPVTLLVIALAAVAAAVVVAYMKFEPFRKVINTVVNAVIGYFELMLNIWIKVINGITGAINGLTGLFSKVGIEIPKIGQIAEVSFGRIGSATDKAAMSAAEFRRIEESQKKTTKETGDVTVETAGAMGGLGKATDKAAEAAKKAAAEIKKLRDGLGESFTKAVEKAGEILQKAKDDFSDYADSVSGAITKAFSFGDAFGKAADANQTLTDAVNKQAEAEANLSKVRKENEKAAADAAKKGLAIQRRIDAERAKGDKGNADVIRELTAELEEIRISTEETAAEKLAEANDELTKSINEVVKAQTQPLTFFDSLEAQAAKARDFGVLVNRLIAGGLSQEALQQVLDAGIDAGSGIATELLNSADGILKANTLAADVAAVGSQVGLNAAGTFKQAGVTAGQALVDGINQAIANYKITLKSKKLSAKQLKKLQKDFNLQVDFTLGNAANVPALANGAIVNRPQMSLIGEAGAEAVIPLTRPARALGLMEQSGLASLARQSSATVSIQNATFVEPIDAQLLAAKVMAAEKSRSFAR